jgi:hypothetical protein
MKMIPMPSSTIAAIGYDPTAKTMTIAFKSGGTYHYAGVPHDIHSGLTSAASVGKYFHAHVRGKYPSNKHAADQETARISCWNVAAAER